MKTADLTWEEWENRFQPERAANFDLAWIEDWSKPEDQARLKEKASANPRTMWTLVDGDGDSAVLISGFHVVNRLAYIFTEEQWEEDIEYWVRDEPRDDYKTLEPHGTHKTALRSWGLPGEIRQMTLECDDCDKVLLVFSEQD